MVVFGFKVGSVVENDVQAHDLDSCRSYRLNIAPTRSSP
jgi:hypothetical protein